MYRQLPPKCTTCFINLPLSHLHVLEAGEGEPLIIVPATISELGNWHDLVQFMAQWFHVYFFELPGHGKSSPFQEKFSSQKVAELIEQLADNLGFERFNLMGFSFGGILAMRTFKRLSHRIDRMMLIAPCVGHHAISYSPFRLGMLYTFNQFVGLPRAQRLFNVLVHNRQTVHWIVKVLQRVGHLEDAIPLERKLPMTPDSTISVLNAQIAEILTTEFDVNPVKYTTPCYFAMSIYDPLLCFVTTLEILERHFAEIKTVRLTYPFHQAPRPFTYDELNRDFHATVESFMQAGAGGDRQKHAIHKAPVPVQPALEWECKCK